MIESHPPTKFLLPSPKNPSVFTSNITEHHRNNQKTHWNKLGVKMSAASIPCAISRSTKTDDRRRQAWMKKAKHHTMDKLFMLKTTWLKHSVPHRAQRLPQVVHTQEDVLSVKRLWKKKTINVGKRRPNHPQKISRGRFNEWRREWMNLYNISCFAPPFRQSVPSRNWILAFHSFGSFPYARCWLLSQSTAKSAPSFAYRCYTPLEDQGAACFVLFSIDLELFQAPFRRSEESDVRTDERTTESTGRRHGHELFLPPHLGRVYVWRNWFHWRNGHVYFLFLLFMPYYATNLRGRSVACFCMGLLYIKIYTL